MVEKLTWNGNRNARAVPVVFLLSEYLIDYDIHDNLSNLKLNKLPETDSIHRRVLYEVRSQICTPLNSP